MEINEALIIIFLMGLSVPLFSYHIFLLAKTARKINYYFAVFSILYSIYIVLFSAIPQTSLIGTSVFQLVPIVKLLVVLGIIYSYYGIIRYGFKIKFSLLTNIYYGIITLAALGWLLFVISRWNYPMRISNLAMEICIQLLLLSFYAVLLYAMFNSKKENKKAIYVVLTCVLALFLTLSILSYVFPYLEMFRYFLIYIPIVLYIYSFYIFNAFVKYESIQEEEYEEERQETVEKLLVAQEENREADKKADKENDLSADTDSQEKINIAFTQELKKNAEHYNGIDNAVPLTASLQEEIFLYAKPNEFDDFIQALFTFIYNTKNCSSQYNMKIECGNENIFLSCGDFSLSAGDKSLNMEKMRLIQLKKSAEQLGGTLSLIKNQENGGMIVRLKFPCLTEGANDDTKVLSFKEGLPTVLLATDSADSLYFFSDIFYDKYNLVAVSSSEDVIEKLVADKYFCLICAMSSDVQAQDVYYAVENQPALSAVPILMLVNEHQSYLELKNYRQFSTVEWINPVEADVIIQELESLRLKIKQTQTRNIEAIDNKMNSAPLENGEKGNKKSVMTQKEFDEKALLYGLTNNEKVVTVLLLHGLEYREIAAKTKASMDKVLAITEAIYRKTGATSKIELIDLFLKNS